LKLKEVEALLLHGDMDQIDRNHVISAFRKKETSILVATDVAGQYPLKFKQVEYFKNLFIFTLSSRIRYTSYKDGSKFRFSTRH
jgi:superfamily II DNA/RNA helicase